MRLPAVILRLFNYSFITTVKQAKGTHTILQLSERSVKGFILAGAASWYTLVGEVLSKGSEKYRRRKNSLKVLSVSEVEKASFTPCSVALSTIRESDKMAPQ